MNDLIEIESSKKKSIVFFTHAPQGTLGDPSAAAKLITKLKAKYSENININIVLIASGADKEKVKNIFQGLDVTVIIKPKFNLMYKGLDIHGRTQDLNQILIEADGVMYFPTFHHFKQSQIKEIEGYYKLSFIATEYDLHPANRASQAKKLGDSKSRNMIINTGLGSGKLGLFCTDEKDGSNNGVCLSQINDSSDLAFKSLLLQGVDAERYHRDHQLFLGYFSKLNCEQKSQNVNPMMFIEACLSKVSSAKKTVDIVMPFVEKNPEGQKGDGEKKYKSVEEIIDYFNCNPSLIQDYKFEVWKKNDQGEVERIECGGTGEKLIRIINGYPFTPKTMDKLMKASDPFVLVTGDQSLSEAISNGKIFIYQTMWWKSELWGGLKNEVKYLLGEDSELYAFLQLQEKGLSSLEEFNTFLKNYENILIEQVKELRQHILENKNLYETLPETVVKYMESPKIYLNACLENSDKLKYQQIKELLKIFPDETTTILKHVCDNNKFMSGKFRFIIGFLCDLSDYTNNEAHSIMSVLAQDQGIQKIAVAIGLTGAGLLIGGILGACLAGGPLGILLGIAVGGLSAFTLVMSSILVAKISSHMQGIAEKSASSQPTRDINEQDEVPGASNSFRGLFSKKTSLKEDASLAASSSLKLEPTPRANDSEDGISCRPCRP